MIEFTEEYNQRLLANSKKSKVGRSIYMVRCLGFDYYKIGIADAIRSRLAQLQVGCPFELVLMAQISLKNSDIVERALHKELADRRIRGEWFRLKEKEACLLAEKIKIF